MRENRTADSVNLPDQTLRILVIEDEPTDYELVARQLKSAGLMFESQRVESFDELQSSLDQFQPDLILSDFSLQGFDGLAALDYVRRSHPDLPFILVTGTLTDVMAFEAVRKGATDYVLKDRLEKLVLTVARAVNERAEKKKLQAAQHKALTVLRKRQESMADFALTQTLRIVLLEDNPADAALIDTELKKSGLNYETVSCDDEEQYRKALTTSKPHVILADFAVPTFDGIAALQLRDALCPDVPFIFLSGIMGEELAIEAVKSGATDYVMKHNLFALSLAVKRAVNEVHERNLRIEAEQVLQINDVTRTITNNMAAALFMLDEAGRCVFVNPMAEKLTQYTAAELRGQLLRDILHSTTANGSPLPAHECYLESPCAHEKITAREEMAVRKDGTVANVLCSATSIKVRGIHTACVVELLDITNEKAMQQFNLNVTAMNEELQTLAQVVSHELQEHVGKIRSYLNLIAVRYQGQLGADADEFISICTNSADVIALMVDDIWTYARINKIDLQQEYVNAGIVVASVAEELRDRTERAGGSIVFGKLPVVFSNEKQLKYLFRSLLDNALKFHSEKPPRVTISAHESGSMWIFAVADNGIGIDPIHSKDVFKIFHRLDAKPNAGGTGMGLAICRKIVERNEGRIWFEGNDSGGTTFYFALPSHVASSGKKI